MTFERHCFYFVMPRARNALVWGIIQLLLKHYLSIQFRYMSIKDTGEVLATIIDSGHVFSTSLLEVQFKV